MVCRQGKMEEDVKPKDEEGVDGRGVCGWDRWVGGWCSGRLIDIRVGT